MGFEIALRLHFKRLKAYHHPQRIHSTGACSFVLFGGELWVVGRIRTTQLGVQKLDSLVAFKRVSVELRAVLRKE
jgi:hypothetical protein